VYVGSLTIAPRFLGRPTACWQEAKGRPSARRLSGARSIMMARRRTVAADDCGVGLQIIRVLRCWATSRGGT